MSRLIKGMVLSLQGFWEDLIKVPSEWAAPRARVFFLLLLLSANLSTAAETRDHYYGHDTVVDQHGVIAPWYQGQNGACDLHIRAAAEALKRYPWIPRPGYRHAPEYAYYNTCNIRPDGTIIVEPVDSITNMAQGDAVATALRGLVQYYRYSGDPAAIAQMQAIANILIAHFQTSADYIWPRFIISNPYGLQDGKPITANRGLGYWIQLEICAKEAFALLWVYQITGDKKILEAVSHWGDLFAEHCNLEPGARPWNRYTDPTGVNIGLNMAGDKNSINIMTGGVACVLFMLDELVRLGYTGENDAIVHARDAGRVYLRDTLLPRWHINDTWGRSLWDNETVVQAFDMTEWVTLYILENKDYFPNWRVDLRNILGLFLNHTSSSSVSACEAYHGAWAVVEYSGKMNRSTNYTSRAFASGFARYAAEADDEWARELTRRMQILTTYEIHENGYIEDDLFGGLTTVEHLWFYLGHPGTLAWTLNSMAWLPELFGASRENHIMHSSSVVNHVVYGDGEIKYTTSDAPGNTVDVLRLAFEPESISAGGRPLSKRSDLTANGYTVKSLSNGDTIVEVRHDRRTDMIVRGNDPQFHVHDKELSYRGDWQSVSQATALDGTLHVSSETSASMTFTFMGNQVRIIGSVGPDGGKADLYLDGIRQLCGIDYWNPRERHQQVLAYKNGLENGEHTIRIIAREDSNPYSTGRRVNVDAVQYSAVADSSGFGAGAGPTGHQRVIFGYPERQDHIDLDGNPWRPATEFVTRTGADTDTVAKTWWTMERALFIEPGRQMPQNPGYPVKDAPLYKYGVHWPEFTANFTVGPGTYYARLLFCETEFEEPNRRSVSIYINDKQVVEDMDVYATGGPITPHNSRRAFDLVFDGIQPENGIIEIRFAGGRISGMQTEAMVQAIEIGPGRGPDNQVKPMKVTGLKSFHEDWDSGRIDPEVWNVRAGQADVGSRCQLEEIAPGDWAIYTEGPGIPTGTDHMTWFYSKPSFLRGNNLRCSFKAWYDPDKKDNWMAGAPAYAQIAGPWHMSNEGSAIFNPEAIIRYWDHPHFAQTGDDWHLGGYKMSAEFNEAFREATSKDDALTVRVWLGNEQGAMCEWSDDDGLTWMRETDTRGKNGGNQRSIYLGWATFSTAVFVDDIQVTSDLFREHEDIHSIIRKHISPDLLKGPQPDGQE